MQKIFAGISARNIGEVSVKNFYQVFDHRKILQKFLHKRFQICTTKINYILLNTEKSKQMPKTSSVGVTIRIVSRTDIKKRSLKLTQYHFQSHATNENIDNKLYPLSVRYKLRHTRMRAPTHSYRHFLKIRYLDLKFH